MNETAAATAPRGATVLDSKRALLATPVAAAASAGGCVLLFFLAKASHALQYVNYQGPASPAAELPIVPVIVSSAVPAILAGVLLAVLAKVAPARALLIFEVIAGTAVIASLAAPLMLPETTTMVSKVVLCAMHVIAGAATVGVLGTMSAKRG